jgi:hypothetical protein
VRCVCVSLLQNNLNKVAMRVTYRATRENVICAIFRLLQVSISVAV